jgi:hypothetical protein
LVNRFDICEQNWIGAKLFWHDPLKADRGFSQSLGKVIAKSLTRPLLHNADFPFTHDQSQIGTVSLPVLLVDVETGASVQCKSGWTMHSVLMTESTRRATCLWINANGSIRELESRK